MARSRLEDDDDALGSLPDLDGDDAADEPLEDATALAVEAEGGEEVGLDDTTGADDPIDTSDIDSLLEDEPYAWDDDRPLASLDAGIEIEEGDPQSWVEVGGREERWDEPLDFDDAAGGHVDDGGLLGIEELLEEDGLGDDEVDLPPLGARDDDGDALGRREPPWSGDG